MAGILGIVGTIGSVVSAGAGIASAFGGGSKSTPNTATGGTPAWQPSAGAMNQAAGDYYSGASGFGNLASGYASYNFPGLQNATNNATSNPYAWQSLAGAEGASGYGGGSLFPMQQAGANATYGIGNSLQGLAGQQQGLGASLQGLAGLQQGLGGMQQGVGSQYTPYISQALQSGFDPQNDLYKQQYHQMLDQQNVINSQNGVAGSPYAAGLATDASQNFNNQWLNNMLQRQSTAAGTAGALGASALSGFSGAGNSYGGAGNAYGQAGNAYSGAGNLYGAAGNAYGAASSQGTDAFNTYNAAGQLPGQTWQTLANNQLGGYQNSGQALGSMLGPYQSYLGNLGSFLGFGQQGQQNAASQAQAGFNQSQINGNNLGQSISGLGSGLNDLYNSFYPINPVQVTPQRYYG